MSEKERKYMPQSGAGLIRYFDVEEQVKIKPHHVIALSIGFAVIIVILKFFA
ncbi:MAG: preprotein translocase subunit Sec61beta [Candidatus Aenigmarchaeota archaeon]|nr:preprotein translocase subunit Sec61beta [Candidatus Aenigmarchaeota archaeon]MDI6722997.1 preprotein translocase subunit Sec61beta [Candidatus Aenigmarchaeota archaeon]